MHVATVDDEVVGFAQFEQCPGEPDTMEVCGLYVSPDFARKGIGRELFRYKESKAKAEGCVVLKVNSTLNARPFYKAEGFHTIKEDIHSVGGQSLLCVFMRKSS